MSFYKISKKIFILMEKYYFHIMTFIFLLKLIIPNQISISIYMNIITLIIFTYNFKAILNSFKINIINFFFILYFLINLFSFIYTINSIYTIDIYIDNVADIVFPMLLYFIGSKKSFSTNNLKIIIDATFLFIFFGLILHFWNPPFYLDYMSSNLSILWNLSLKYDFLPRFFGLMVGPQIPSHISVVSIILILMVNKDGGFSKKNMFLILIFAFSIFLSLQRAAWFNFILVLFVVVFNIIVKKLDGKFLIIILVTLFSILILVNLNFIIQIDWNIFTDRIESFSGILEDRFENVRNLYAIETFKENIFGVGLMYKGSLDGNFHRIIMDLGVFGIFSGGLFIIFSIFNTIYRKNIYILLFIIVYIIGSLGSPIFDGFYSSHIFWLILGFSNNHRIY